MIRVIADHTALDAARQHIAATDAQTAAKTAAAKTEASQTKTQTTLNKAAQDQTTPDEAPAATTEQPAALEDQSADDTGDCQPPALPDTGLALLPGAKIMPTAVLAEAIRNGATIGALHLPGPDCEAGYRPSAALAEFVRIRDMFCRFPGCSVPADHCDIDHSTPWPYGPSHPSNLNCKCGGHRRLKDLVTSTARLIHTDKLRACPKSRHCAST